jgi:poly(hydroxyalkanoate) depolymerase family esterase
MRLSETLLRLNAARGAFKIPELSPDIVDRLEDLSPLHGNPGNLHFRFYVPESLQHHAPLVVVLHGCTQNAASYDHGSGWSQLAERQGFALLFPEQQRTNNPNLCFNWFEPGDTSRGSGEAASIASAIAAMVERHKLDAGRIFITGLSAGGAMAAAMLATYPELFAGGAIIAGLPYGCASNVAEAFGCMSGRDKPSAQQLGAKVRAASTHSGPWPRISVWQGSDDRTVVPSNAEAIVRQWTNVHALPSKPSLTETVDGYPRRVWTDSKGEALIEQYVVTGMAHGTPLAPESGLGEAGAHMLDVGLSSTARIGAFFGIAPVPAQAATTPAKKRPAAAADVSHVIEAALKTAGLTR